MTRELSARKIVRTLSLGAVSYLALSMESSGDLQDAVAQSNLPPVTVDAPKPRVRQPVQRSQSIRASRGQRSVAAAAPRQAAPVPYVVPSTGTVGTVPPAYAGGQVATGGSLGLLGNRGVMNTPFNQTSYTAELIQNQQARTIRDVLANDPSVRVVQAAGGGADGLFIRGFYYDSGDYGLNGLYGIAPYYSSGANFVERVEVLKGPSALLNGMTAGGTGVASGGAVGGSVNLITKHAPDFDITQLTATYASRSQFGGIVDVSRRYGEHKEWGVRLNSTYSNGNTPWNRQTDEFGNAVLGLDYRGERVRAAVDIGYQADNLNPPLRFFNVPATTTVIPPPPKAGLNFQVPWAYYAPTDFFTTARGEVDVTDWMTAYGAFGYHDSNINYAYPSPNISNVAPGALTSPPGVSQLGGLWSRPFAGKETFETLAGEAGIRATFDTGPVNHALNVNYSINDRTYNQRVLTRSSNALADLIFWNLYTEPTNIAKPNFSTVSANQKTGVTLSSVGASDTMSILNNRVQVTLGVRRQTAGSEVTNFLTPASSRPQQDTSVWSPAYAVLVKPVENVALYANYIEGLQTPVVVSGNFSNVGTVFPPAQTKQAEAGMKIDAGRFTTTLSVFDISQPSIISVASGVSASQQLNGRQRNRGVELNVFGEITPDIRVLGGVALIDGVQERTQGGLTDGRTAVGVPVVNVNMGAEWDTPFVRGLTFTSRVIYTGSQYVNAANTLTLPEWTRVDIGARYTFTSPWNGKPIVVRANVENVGNKAYWASAYNGVITLGAPRTYLVSTTFNF
ncbi:TonB-dependent receptor [Bradyrhizobium sp. NBAIM20]|uniref:TonB-dependent receptor n=1 Tax=unclassified Bradyrhizobium TaxID=2631580 RepID=UPI001CD47611|nr:MULTISPECIES: TonB-dependent receptor [unclassified Bradyrhizobium]MCA1415243.1 TonB-dependent receptor [Bradyrhizobium sp. NBAIM20]MCA1460453.1 TonB-dependent receptor [Bradyrhizobium sp. NBAIM18]